MNRQEAIEGINDKLKDLKYYAKEMGKVLKSTNYFIDELERQAKKVERPKLKAWHVRDEYSFKELQKELESKGIHKYKGQEYLPADFFKDNNSIYVFVENETWHTSSWYNLPSDRYIIEYHKEEPKFYAKIKGWEHVEYRPHYWVKAYIRDRWYKELDKSINSNLDTAFPRHKEAYTKTEWAKLGITDENADFVEVE